MQWRYKEKRNDQEHHENVRFFHLAKFLIFFFLFCFVFEKMSFSISMFLVMLLAVHRCSPNQVFLKILQYPQEKNLRWSLFLIKFQDWRSTFLFKKRLQRRCFSVNIAKFLRTAFLLNNCSLYLFEIFISW